MTHVTKRIPIGVDNFEKLVDKANNYLFVDKTLMIKEFIDNGDDVALILRPRRWGKSLNMSMLRYFFAPEVIGKPTKGIFDDLKIAKERDGEYIKEYQGKHPVMTISFKDVKERDFETAIGKIGSLIYDVISEFALLPSFLDSATKLKVLYDNLLHKKATNDDLQESFKLLSGYLYTYYNQKVIIIIDEYDTPLNASYSDPKLFGELVGFFKGFFGAALKGNDALEKGVMTGILRLSKNNMLSDLNNLGLYSMGKDKYSSAFGFFENDVVELFNQAKVECDLPEIKTWYNGYQCGKRDGIYNPWSILNCISENGALGPYWVKTGNDDLLRDIFLNASEGTKEKLQTLLSGQQITSVIDDFISFEQIRDGREELLWSALWALGYLKITKEIGMDGIEKEYELMVPNHEVDCSYRTIFLRFFQNLSGGSLYTKATKALIAGNVEEFEMEFRKFLLASVSFFDTDTENSYHMFVLGMLSALKNYYKIISNRESGLGRPDIILMPRERKGDLGIVMEFKRGEKDQKLEHYKKMATEALAQIKEKKYDACFADEPNVKRILNIALVFYGKDFVCEFLFEEIR